MMSGTDAQAHPVTDDMDACVIRLLPARCAEPRGSPLTLSPSALLVSWSYAGIVKEQHMHPLWPALARRIVQGLGVQPGELIQVRGDVGDLARLQELVLAIEVRGATPRIEIGAAEYLRLLGPDACGPTTPIGTTRRAMALRRGRVAADRDRRRCVGPHPDARRLLPQRDPCKRRSDGYS
jgi:hypothetical protein